MEMVELEEVKDKLIRNLSKGFKQRTGMAQALLGDPDIIILDEPTVGLDPKQIIEIRDLIRSLKGKHTVILSSHILSEVSAVCDRILILSRGRLAAEGTPEELESMMHGDRELELTVRGDREAVNHVLSEIEGIESFEIKENGEKKSEDELDVTVRQREGSDIRDKLSLKLAERGVPVYKLKINEKSLEDIFLELTEEQEVSL